MEIFINNKSYCGEKDPCYIVMDAAANHNGDLETAKKLIKTASQGGANAIKFQTYTADKLYSSKTPRFYPEDPKPYEVIKKYQHPREWLPILNDFAKENNIDFSSSPFDFEAVDLLEELDVPFYKIASSEIVDLELINYVAKKQKPIILSTGMSYLSDIEDAIKTIIKNNNKQIILLQCNTIYPTPVDIINLRAMITLKEKFKFPVGLSDHSLGIHISLAAVAMGAKVIEKHLTLDRKQEGPDHHFSLEFPELKEMVEKIRDIESAMGDGIKEPHERELKEKFVLGRRSIIAAKNIPKGTIITRDMLIVKRPSLGIKPKHISSVIGKEAKVDIEYDQWITWDMIKD